MGTAESLYDDLRSKLRLSTRIVRRVGKDINVGEKFTMRFTVTNTSFPIDLTSHARIVFLKPEVYAAGTTYAKPTGGNTWHAFKDTRLAPGESTSIDVEFEAIDEIDGWFEDLFVTEEVARAVVRAKLDTDTYFTLRTFTTVREEIERT